MIIINFFKDLFINSIQILNGASVWLIFSFILAGFLHEFLSPDRFQKSLGNKKISSLLKSTISGMFLPICSCGVIPLGISMYYSGAYLGPTLAFMTSTPIINPVAVVLSLGLLGPKITIIYVITGFALPILMGLMGNFLSAEELHTKNANVIKLNYKINDDRGIVQKIKDGMMWAIGDLSIIVSKYVVLGMLCAGLIFTIAPSHIIGEYLGSPSLISLGGICILSAVMYVCAVGHIPFIAALVASGASPGVAITFLLAGAATNLPELISIYKVIGKRSMLIYSLGITSMSLIVGYVTNLLLMPGFKPALDVDSANVTVNIANKMIFTAPEQVKYVCSAIIIGFAIKSVWKNINLCKQVSLGKTFHKYR